MQRVEYHDSMIKEGNDMEVTAHIREFLTNYQKALADNDTEAIGELYAEHFMFADPHGVRPVERAGFLAVAPKRKQLFDALGLIKTDLTKAEEEPLSEGYGMVRVTWTMHFEKNGKAAQSVNKATYLLREHGGKAQIVFQLDHQDLIERARELGLL